MQGGRFCNPPRVPPATHALYSNLPEALSPGRGPRNLTYFKTMFYSRLKTICTQSTNTKILFVRAQYCNFLLLWNQPLVMHQFLWCCTRDLAYWDEIFSFFSKQSTQCIMLVFVQCLVRYITMHQRFDTRWCNCSDAPVSCLCPRCCTRAKSFRPRPARLPQTSPLDNGSHDGQWPAYDRI